MQDMPELLAPAGSYDAARAALAAGADAIYCALGHAFNARRSADNFDEDSFAAFCKEAHLAGARVYVPLNIVIKSQELTRALALVNTAWRLGADAFIIQDWGLFFELRSRWPQIECHISTQANIHDVCAAAWCAQMGASRVTLSRELSLDEIAQISALDIETEVFTHGALCFCYSGECGLSAAFGKRSANRGMCAQPCRLEYKLLDEKGNCVQNPRYSRLLCPKDMCAFDDVGELARVGVSSYKIEGRMKTAEYVYAVIKAYRGQIDAWARELGDSAGNIIDTGVDTGKINHASSAATDANAADTATAADAADAATTTDATAVTQRKRLLERSFNRGFTDSYLHGRADNSMMSYERSNNQGQLVGQVVASQKLGDVYRTSTGTQGGRPRKRRFTQARITVQLTQSVNKGDLLEFRPESDPTQFLTATLESDGKAGSQVSCIAARVMPRGCAARLIRSQRIKEDTSHVLTCAIVRKHPVRVQVQCHLAQPFILTMTTVDASASVRVKGPQVERAKTRALTQDSICEHVCRMGATPFEPVSIDIALDDDCGMSFSAIHALRTQAADLLAEKILQPYTSRTSLRGLAGELAEGAPRASLRESTWHTPSTPASYESELCVMATSSAVASDAARAGADRIYVPYDELSTTSSSTTHLAYPDGCIPWFDEVCRNADHDRLAQYVQAHHPSSVVVGTMSELIAARKQGIDAEISSAIPVHNPSCLQLLESMGATGTWLSFELTLQEIARIAQGAHSHLGNHRGNSLGNHLGLVVYGRPRVMTSEHCVFMAADRCIHDCKRCRWRHRRMMLQNDTGALMPVQTDCHGRSRIYGPHIIDTIAYVDKLKEAGISRFAIDARFLSPTDVVAQLARLRSALADDVASVAHTPTAATGFSRNGTSSPTHAFTNRVKTDTTTGHLFVGIE